MDVNRVDQLKEAILGCVLGYEEYKEIATALRGDIAKAYLCGVVDGGGVIERDNLECINLWIDQVLCGLDNLGKINKGIVRLNVESVYYNKDNDLSDAIALVNKWFNSGDVRDIGANGASVIKLLHQVGDAEGIIARRRSLMENGNTVSFPQSSVMLTQVPTLRSYRDWETDRKSTRLNSSHSAKSRMPSSA